MPATPCTVKVAYVTDRSFLRPTLVSVWSLLRHLSGPAELHLWGAGLTPDDWADVQAIAAPHSRVALHCRDIATLLDGAHGPTDHISAATMGRLFIPRLIGGRVLYIDGDTLVTGDVAPLFAADLGGALAGVVRDHHIARWLSKPVADRAGHAARLAEIAGLLAPLPPAQYFNAGVLLLDCDGLRARPDLLARIEDAVAASACTHGDQDHLNALLKHDLVFLDPAWNASWGRVGRHRRLMGRPDDLLLPGRARIIHYHGPEKPWRKARWDPCSSRGRATLTYRRALRRFLRSHPHLKPA